MDVLKQTQVQEVIHMELISCIKNFPKHTKTAFQNVYRNGVMSVSSIFSVAITLLLIGLIGIVSVNIYDITYDVEEKLTIYVQIERSLSDDEAKALQPQIEAIEGIESVTFYTKEEELDKIIEKQSESGKELFESYRKNNPLGAAYVVEVVDSHTMDDIAQQIQNIDHVNTVEDGGNEAMTLIDGLETIRNGGSVFVVALCVMALLMIANTIKMTITARQTEISIMRMVGASNWYIRLPFMLEGMIIGILGSIVPIAILAFGYVYVFNGSADFFSGLISLREPYPFMLQGGLALAAFGGGVGLIGSFVSIRRFLRF